MLMMHKQDTAKYPKFAKYVRTEMPKMAQDNAIVEAIQKLAGKISKKAIQDALQWGRGPQVELKFFPPTPAPGGGMTYVTGGYTKGSNILTINEYYVSKFEVGDGLRKTPKRQMVVLVGVILLHELVHWADEKDGIADSPNLEVGEEFEKEIYGEVVTSH